MVVPFLQNSTFTGLISTRDYGTSQDWQNAYQQGLNVNSSIAHYLSANDVIIKSVVINNNITVLGEQASFNQGVATGLFSFAANGGVADNFTSFAVNDAHASGDHGAALNSSEARGSYSTGCGFNTEAIGSYSHVEGSFTAASGVAAHAEGTISIAAGDFSHAENDSTIAQGVGSHSQGDRTQALGDYSHSEGQLTEAKGYASHAGGFKSTAANEYTSIWSDGNLGTITENVSTTKDGQYMIDASGGVYITGSLGIGTDSTDNALTVNGAISGSTIYANAYLSGGINLLDALSSSAGREDVNTTVVLNSANWISTHTTVINNSANWDTSYAVATTFQTTSANLATRNFITTNFLPLSGGTITSGLSVEGDGFFKQNVTVLGNLTALGTTTFASTVFNTSTSALSVVNYGPGPALYVFQGPGNFDVASFYDGDGIEVLHVGNANPNGLGYVGVNESFPNKELTVRGSISATEILYVSGGNSNTWNNASTTVQNTSGVTTFLQSNSSYFLTQNNNFTLDTNASIDYLNWVYNPTSLIKVSQQNTVYQDYSGNVINLSGAGNCFSGNISYDTGTTSTAISLSCIFPNQNYYVTYNNLDYLYGSIGFNWLSTTLSAVRFPSLKLCSGGITLQGALSLTEINFSELEYLGSGGLIIGNNLGGYAHSTSWAAENIKNVEFPKLKVCEGSLSVAGYGLNYNPLLSSVKFDNLEKVGGIGIGGSSHFGPNIVPYRFYPNLYELSFPNLYENTGNITLSQLTNITTISLPRLKRMRGLITLAGCTSFRDLNLPELEFSASIGGYIFNTLNSSGTTSLTSISIPKLKIIAGVGPWIISTDASLRNLELGTDTLTQFNYNGLTCNQVLTQQSVDNILKAFSRLDGNNNTVLYTGSLTLAGGNSAPSYTGGTTTTGNGSLWNRYGATVVAFVVNHGLTTGDIVTFTGNTVAIFNGTYVVTKNSNDQFQYTVGGNATAQGGGTVTMRRTSVPTDGFRYYQNIALRGNTITINLP